MFSHCAKLGSGNLEEEAAWSSESTFGGLCDIHLKGGRGKSIDAFIGEH